MVMKIVPVLLSAIMAAVSVLARTAEDGSLDSVYAEAGKAEAEHGKYSEEYVRTLMSLTSAYLEADDLDNSLATALEAYEIADSLGYGDVAAALAGSAGYGYKWLAGRCGDDYAKARDLYSNSIHYFSAAGPSYGGEIKSVRLKLAATYCHEADGKYEGGDYAAAVEIMAGIALPMVESVAGRVSYEYATAAGNLAVYYDAAGDYRQAVATELEVLGIERSLSGEDDKLRVAKSFGNLCTYYYSAGDYDKAVKAGMESVAIYQAGALVGDDEISGYSTALDNLAIAYSEIGMYDKALELEKKSLDLITAISGEESWDYAVSLTNYASLEESAGNYVDAMRDAEKAVGIMAGAVGKGHPDYARSLKVLANACSAAGDYSKALALEKKSSERLAEALGERHPDYIVSLNNLASTYSHIGERDSALIVGKKAVELSKSVHGENHPDYITTLGNLAGYYAGVSDFTGAIAVDKEVLELVRRNYGEDYPGYAMTLNNICNYEIMSGNAAGAVAWGERALTAYGRIYGERHPDYTTALENLIAAYFFSGDYGNCEKYIGAVNRNRGKEIRSGFAGMTNAERSKFWNKYRHWYEEFLPNYAFRIGSDSLRTAAYDGLLLSKGLLLNSDIEMRKLVAESGDTSVLRLFDEMNYNRRMLGKLYGKPVAERGVDTDSLALAVERQERQLVERCKAYGDYTRNLAISWQDVEKRLAPGEIAVEFLSFATQGDVQYAALVLKKGYRSPEMIPLFKGSQLEGLDINLYYSSSSLYSLVWQPLEKELKGIERVYFAPAGELYNIAVEYVLTPDLKIISDSIEFYRLSSTRQLALDRVAVNKGNAAVYGGLRYDTGIATLDRDSRGYGLRGRAARSQVADLALRGAVSDLPGTKVEAEEICESLKGADMEVEIFTDTVGTEASFKNLHGEDLRLLHIATHGFYWTEREASRMDFVGFLMRGDDRAAVEDKALTRSGLLFAGANNALQGKTLPDGVEDGILTAQEIASLDFNGLDLVVLSACQTGLGEITGDGVFGLQRGFKKAGAGTLLMSLWKVDDDATRLLMTCFYHNLLSGMGKYESLKEAQRYVRDYTVTVEVKPDVRPAISVAAREEARKRRQEEKEYKKVQKYRDPYYWAGFILLDAVW